MFPHRALAHPVLAVGTLAMTVVLLSGCSPTPQPTSTPTAAFASEEEAFQAAEQTYREFTARLNQIDIADPATFEPLFELSSGSFERADREAYSTMHADGLTIDGQTVIVSFDGITSAAPYTTVTAAVCLDVHDVTVVDSGGDSRVAPERPDVYALRVTFVASGTRMLIDAAQVDEDAKCGV